MIQVAPGVPDALISLSPAPRVGLSSPDDPDLPVVNSCKLISDYQLAFNNPHNGRTTAGVRPGRSDPPAHKGGDRGALWRDGNLLHRALMGGCTTTRASR